MTSITEFFWKTHLDPYAIYDSEGNRYWTGGLERIEKLIISKRIYESR